MSYFKWTNNFETGIKTVDEEHFVLVGLINKLGSILTKQEVDFFEYTELVKELVAYTAYHFSSEEKIMLDVGIDKRHYDSHIKKHIDFVTEISRASSEITSVDLDKMKNLIDFLINWLVYHILIDDQNMAAQLSAIKSGVSPSDAYDEEEKKSANSVGPLIEALNALVEQLSKKNKELHIFNETLEQQVEKRTRELLEINKILERQALTDSLTKLPNRRHCMRELSLLWQESIDENLSLSCIMIDLDHFKIVNDTCGHDAGDEVLCLIARELMYSVRSDDLVCRLGGDEFMVLCSKTDENGVKYLAEKIHKNIASLELELSHMSWKGSASIGIASRKPKMKSYEELIKLSDKNIYTAKEDGKNCVRG